MSPATTGGVTTRPASARSSTTRSGASGPTTDRAGSGTLVVDGPLPWGRRRLLTRALRVAGPLPGRYRYVHDVRGPKVRIGVVWFVLVVAASQPGQPPWPLALLLAAVAGVAATQAAAAHRREQRGVSPFVPGVAAVGVVVAAVAGPQALGAAVLLAVAATASAALPAVGLSARPRRGTTVGGWATLDDVATGVRCWLFVGLAAASPVLLARVEVGRVIVLLFLAAAYDVGDYLVGSASSNAVEGPLAGLIGVLVMTFAAAVVDPPGFGPGQVWTLGLLAAVLCPLGPLAASAVLPRAGAFAPALRRLDSLLLVAPAWVLAWR
jgi:hypothetical protein